MAQIRILSAAARELERLDPAVARRIVRRMRWLAENLEHVHPEALSGEFAGLFKPRPATTASCTRFSGTSKRL
jgi:mRNA-degrading endonuclease RelE of RelBE toxin-antitoxin system